MFEIVFSKKANETFDLIQLQLLENGELQLLLSLNSAQ